ncbi:MAG: phospholipase [Armatimonadetes bacterium]|nr:phospholipase [Armatimonadota bacterium]
MKIQLQETSQAGSGRLTARPLPVEETAPRGLLRLGLGTLRDGLIYVPASYQANQPAPLVLCLHGAGGNAQQGMRLLQGHADRHGFLVLAVDSRGSTWDLLRGGYGPDVEFINRALMRSFERYAVDPERLAVAGFSDGASYALSIGLTNGDLFRSVMAFSPGFMAPAAQRGQPPIFISHGKGDKVLPIEKCSRRIVPQLQRAGYAVLYREFDGPHTIPAEIEAEAVEWWFAQGTIQKPA